MAKQCIGLDIGSSSVKVVELKGGKRGYTLKNFGVEPLASQTIVDGAIMDQTAVVDAIRALWGRLKIRGKDVAIAIAGHSVIIKNISVPRMTAEELEEQLPREAANHIPFSTNEVEIDFDIVNRNNAQGQMDVALVAAKKEVVYDYVQVVRDASLNPVVVDVAAFSMQNAFESNYTTNPGDSIVLINVGASISNINIVSGGVSLFTRDITIGGNTYTEDIQKELGVSYEEAEAYKLGGAAGEQGVVPVEVDRVMDRVSNVLAGEFQRSLDFFLATSDTGVAKICMAGGGARVSTLATTIEKRSRLPVELMSAWNAISTEKVDQMLLTGHAQDAVVALGLAMRGPNDKVGG